MRGASLTGGEHALGIVDPCDVEIVASGQDPQSLLQPWGGLAVLQELLVSETQVPLQDTRAGALSK
eukprot:4627654-Lingulodinium_polyedra.AAC.1